MTSISLQDYFLNPRTSWEMTGEKEFFDELLSSISGIEDVSNFFNDFSIIYPLGSNICLLYTSPSPRDQRGSRMPSSA